MVSGLNGSNRLLLVGNILYYSQQDNISYIDITEANPTPTILISNLNDAAGLEIKDNFLYIAHFGESDVIKVDLDDPTPSVIDVTFFGNTPNMLKFNGNDLYFTDNNGHRIYKYDITSGSPSAENHIIRDNEMITIEVEDAFIVIGYNENWITRGLPPNTADVKRDTIKVRAKKKDSINTIEKYKKRVDSVEKRANYIESQKGG